MAEYFGDQPEKGLVSVMLDQCSLQEAVVHQADCNIDVLYGGASKVNAADLFASDRFSALMDQAREAYDYIVIDTPPVLVVPDARVIGSHADSIIFNVKWNATPQGQIQAGLGQLRSVGLQVSGIALSQINPRGMRRYGHSGAYGYEAYGTAGAAYYGGK